MAEQYELSRVIMKYMDRHMVLPLLEFLEEQKIYPRDDILHAKLQLVSKTKMVDSAIEEYKSLYKTEEIPQAMEDQRTEVYAQLTDWKDACQPLLDVITDQSLVKELQEKQKFDIPHLKTHHKVTEEHVENLYRYAKLNFDCGRYRDAADFLDIFRALSRDKERKFWALWGHCAA
jgi:translation initiation factor 3 subunit E